MTFGIDLSTDLRSAVPIWFASLPFQDRRVIINCILFASLFSPFVRKRLASATWFKKQPGAFAFPLCDILFKNSQAIIFLTQNGKKSFFWMVIPLSSLQFIRQQLDPFLFFYFCIVEIRQLFVRNDVTIYLSSLCNKFLGLFLSFSFITISCVTSIFFHLRARQTTKKTRGSGERK